MLVMIHICKRVVCALLAVATLCGDLAGAKGKVEAPAVAAIETAQQAINALKEAEIIRTEKKDARVLSQWMPKSNGKAPELSKTLLKHFEAFQKSQEELKDYPYVETVMRLFKCRYDKQKRFPTGALEPFYAIADCRPKNIPLLVQACYRPMPEHEIKTLLAAGEKPNAKDADGDTALHAAARCCLGAKVLQMLIKAGASVNVANNDGYTPLHLAAQAGADAKSLRVLLDAGANQKATAPFSDVGVTPGMAAMESCTAKSLNELVKAGMDLNVAGVGFRGASVTPLMILCQVGITVEELAVFRKAGVNLNARCFTSRMTPALLALCHADEKLVRAFADAKADFTIVDANGQTSLHDLCSNMQVTPGMFDIVYKSQKNVNAVDNLSKQTPLHIIARRSGSVEVAKRLLKAGAKKDMKDRNGKTPLDLAREKQHEGLVQLLSGVPVTAGATKPKAAGTAKKGEAAPTDEMSAQGAIDALKGVKIIRTEESQASISLVSSYWRVRDEEKKLLAESRELLKHFDAFQQGKEKLTDYPYIEKIIHLFKGRGNRLVRFPAGALEPFYAIADCRPKEMPLLVQACYRPMPDHEIKTLLAAGEDPNAKDADGETALHAAARCCLGAGVLKALLKAGASVNAANNDGYTPLHLAAQAGADEKSLRALLEAGADPQARGITRGITPMMMAIESCTAETLSDLVKVGMDLNDKGKMNINAFYLLCWRGISLKELEVCLKAGVKMNERMFVLRTTPAMVALFFIRDAKLLQTFIDAGADFTITDANGLTGLHNLAENEYVTSEMMDIMHKIVKDVNVVDREKQTPLHLCARWGFSVEAAKWLLKHGANKEARDRDGRTPLDSAREKRRGDRLREEQEKNRREIAELLSGS